MSSFPTFEQVVELPALVEGEVQEKFIDENGHMNIRDFMAMTSWAVWRATQDAGMDEAYMTERKMSMFTVEHHIRYLSELRLGQAFTVHVRLLDRSARAVQALAFLVDRENSRVACTLEAMLVHVSFEGRRSVPIPDDVATKLDEQIEASRALSWDAPVCGVMSIRR